VSQCDELRRHPHPKNFFSKKIEPQEISAGQRDFYARPAEQSPPSTTRPRWDSEAGGSTGGRKEGEDGRNSHEGSRGIPTRGGGSRTARLPPPPPSPASRASPEISSELELELESRGSFNFSLSFFWFFFFPSSGEVASAPSRIALHVLGLDPLIPMGWALLFYMLLSVFL
jgi:hypothetical protein